MGTKGRQSKPLMVYLPDPVLKAVKEAAALNELPMSSYVRQIIEETVTRQSAAGVKTPLQRLQELEARVGALEEALARIRKAKN